MEIYNIIISVVSGVLGVISTLLYFSLKIGKYIEKIDTIERSTTRINALELQVAALQQFEKNAGPKIFISKSPLTLSIYAENLLKEVDFYSFFENIKEDLAKRIDQLHLKTRYDVQEKCREMLSTIKDEDIFIPLKTIAYNKGRNYNDIIAAASIPLRDYYLSVHPEIKD